MSAARRLQPATFLRVSRLFLLSLVVTTATCGGLTPLRPDAARASQSAIEHTPVRASWGAHLRTTPNPPVQALPAPVGGLQPVPLSGGRTMLLRLPPQSDMIHPLIFALHGLYNGPSNIEAASGFDSL